MSQPFAVGTLWDRVGEATNAALGCGALLPISTDISYVPQMGVEFAVRRVKPLKEKYGATRPTSRDPFLHPEKALRVADVSETHVCLLNKFPVFSHHLLIVTRAFVSQDAPLGFDDLLALWRCMAEGDGLGFYNGGILGGASQAHRHLQLVPLPLASRGAGIPIEPMLHLPTLAGELGTVDALPFDHTVARLPEGLGLEAVAEFTTELYTRMLRQLARKAGSTSSPAYNLLLTHRWMLLVPRFHECYRTISLNALAFAGCLLVRSDTEREIVREHGPMALLTHVSTQ